VLGWTYIHQGGRFDIVSGLFNFRNREYNIALSRWMQRDPVESGANLYEYANGGPIESVDPAGLDPGGPGQAYWPNWKSSYAAPVSTLPSSQAVLAPKTKAKMQLFALIQVDGGEFTKNKNVADNRNARRLDALVSSSVLLPPPSQYPYTSRNQQIIPSGEIGGQIYKYQFIGYKVTDKEFIYVPKSGGDLCLTSFKVSIAARYIPESINKNAPTPIDLPVTVIVNRQKTFNVGDDVLVLIFLNASGSYLGITLGPPPLLPPTPWT
jgi:RHS repeat-associated protein